MNYKRHRGNFAVALKKVADAKQKQTFATPAQAMDERIRQGVNADICTEGAWYNASFSEVNKRILATRGQFNPLIDYAKQVVKAMKTGEFYLTDKILLENEPAVKVLERIAEQDAKKPVYKQRVVDLGKIKTHNVSTDCFADDKTIVFLAENKTRANDYGLFLRNKEGIKQTKVYMQDIIGKNKLRGFWLYGLGVGWLYGLGVGNLSEFGCDGRGLCGVSGSLFGGYESAEGTSPKILPYTTRQAEKYLAILRGVKEGNLSKSKLEKVISFFNQKR